MYQLKLQVGCLSVVLYIIIMYLKDTVGSKYPCNKYFDAILYIAPWAIVFDGASAWTVNHLSLVSHRLNLCVHLIFFLLMDAMLTVNALYMFDQIVGFKGHKLASRLMSIPGIIAAGLIVAGIGQTQFIEGNITNYSMGISVYICFAAVFLYYSFIILLVLMLHKNLTKDKKIGAISFTVLIGALLVVQLVFPEFLITSVCSAIMLLGIYIVFENPAMRRLEIQNEKITDSFANMVESRDNNTGGHIKRTKLYVQLLLRKMQKDGHYAKIMSRDYITYVTEAAPLHDIGKIATPDAILQKPGKLTDEEYAIMKQHAACGGDIILNTLSDNFVPEAKTIVYETARYHHEKYNGKGYPDGLLGEEIPLHARVMAIADVFDAVSQNRCYREAMPLEKCFSIIENGAGTDFDPHLVRLFLEAKDEVSALCEEHRE